MGHVYATCLCGLQFDFIVHGYAEMGRVVSMPMHPCKHRRIGIIKKIEPTKS